MKYFSSKRSAVRVFTFMCAALAVSVLTYPLAEIGMMRADTAELDAIVCGIDALTDAVCGIADGRATESNVKAAEISLMLLPLNGETAESVGEFLRAAESTPPHSKEYAMVSDYAKALYTQLRAVGDRIASEGSSPSEAASMLPTLCLSLPLPEIPPEENSNAAEVRFGLLSGQDEVSEGEARDTASKVIGKCINLRLNPSNRRQPEVYSFYCSNAYADITKYGGYLVRYSLAVTPDAAVLSTEEALRLLDRFVYEHGFGKVELCDLYEEGGFLRAVYQKRGLDPLTSPKIKAGIALDTGKICYYDAYEFMKYS
nr:germination protein YpeB [Clostridia bacterium]